MFFATNTTSGNTPYTYEGNVAAAQTFQRGAPVKFDASKNVIEAVVADTAILGFAEHAANPVAPDPARVTLLVANDDTHMVGKLTAAQAIAATDVGLPAKLAKVGADWQVDKSGAGILIIDAILDPVGTVNGKVMFHVIPSGRLMQY